MRKCSRATRIEFPRFRGDDVKGWLSKSKDIAWVIYKDAILKRFGNSFDNSSMEFSSSNSDKDSNLHSRILDKLDDLLANGSHFAKKNTSAHNMFNEMPNKILIHECSVLEFVKRSMEFKDNNNCLMGVGEVSKACDEGKEFESKKLSVVVDDYNCFEDCNKLVQESEKDEKQMP
nr:hypothetical protein [Tanacetum cinerariifolium]